MAFYIPTFIYIISSKQFMRGDCKKNNNHVHINRRKKEHRFKVDDGKKRSNLLLDILSFQINVIFLLFFGARGNSL